MENYYIPGELLVSQKNKIMIRYVGFVQRDDQEILLGLYNDRPIIIDPSEFIPIDSFMSFSRSKDKRPKKFFFKREDIVPLVKLYNPIVIFTVQDRIRTFYAIFEEIDASGFLEEFDEITEKQKLYGTEEDNFSLYFMPITQTQKNRILNKVYRTNSLSDEEPIPVQYKTLHHTPELEEKDE